MAILETENTASAFAPWCVAASYVPSTTAIIRQGFHGIILSPDRKRVGPSIQLYKSSKSGSKEELLSDVLQHYLDKIRLASASNEQKAAISEPLFGACDSGPIEEVYQNALKRWGSKRDQDAAKATSVGKLMGALVEVPFPEACYALQRLENSTVIYACAIVY
jgi:hypothetical protein